VDAKPKEDEPPSKFKAYFLKALALGILIYCGILYIQDHSWTIEKVDDKCPLYSHRVYGELEECTLLKFSRLEDEDDEPDTDC
jgi:hypothetical protein